MKKLLSIILPLLFACVPLLAQDKINVKGTVKDKLTGETLIGVSVKVDGTALGTITDLDGMYNLSDIPKNSLIIFSYVGMKSETAKQKSRNYQCKLANRE